MLQRVVMSAQGLEVPDQEVEAFPLGWAQFGIRSDVVGFERARAPASWDITALVALEVTAPGVAPR
jgi:hypothetical protein